MDTTVSVLIGLGSNLQEPARQIDRAILALKDTSGIDVRRQSSLYRSSPQGPQDQPAFINAAVLCQTRLSPSDLLAACQKVEQSFGRQKLRHWGERVIDLDILFYGRDTVHHASPDLVIPHPMATQRDFVLLPCLEICPDWVTPQDQPLSSFMEFCPDHQVEKLEE